MAVSETDLELLETFLDNALSPSETNSVRQRLVEDGELSAALTELRSQRVMRSAVWAALEPTDTAAQQMNWRIRGALADRQTARQTAFGSWWTARIGSVAAACITLGFFAGWMGHGAPTAPIAVSPQAPTTPVAVNQQQPSPTAVAQSTPLFVPVTNEYGQVVAWQQFQNADQAKNFVEDLHRTPGETVVSPADDKVKLVSEQKF